MKNEVFMKGNWQDLIIKTYTFSPNILEHYIPNDVYLDLYQNKALFSMVAFTFSKVKFFDFKIPFHQQFGEINFRVYVKSKLSGKKGVVFLKEFAPKPIMSCIARFIYNEPFFYRNIKQSSTKDKIDYSFKVNNQKISINAKINREIKNVTKSTLQKFIVDRYIAFVKGKKTLEYKIKHKPWKVINKLSDNIPNDVLNLLPKPFKNSKEISTYVIDGSSVEVEKGILIN